MAQITCAVLCFLSRFAIILMGKRELVVLLCWSSWCLVTVIVLWLFLALPWVGLQCVVVFPGHTHSFFFAMNMVKVTNLQNVM